MEVVPGVHTIDGLGMGRAFIYAEQDKLTLIDSGLPNSAEKIFAAIAAIGRRPEDLRQVIITHYHNDHAGSLADIVERSGAAVLAHPLDAPVLQGERPPPPASAPALVRWLLSWNAGGHAPAPVHVSREVDDGDEIDMDDGARVVHTPGHTPGSIAVHLPHRKLLFAGDAAGYFLGLRPPFPLFTEDKAAARASIRKLAELDFDAALLGHGRPLETDAARAFRKLAAKLAN